ncbi:MAG: NAD(P)/FAD-dependent oxidoreductase, partial [Clostridia bacterium]|nr:NAD(P)/FAD-dependent oxidoreductase [Clostridia bacterium]
MDKKVIIIGAGLAGLSAGIYLQQKGVQTEIFELAGWAGGMCTTWERGGYRFDGCIHWMVGTKKGDGIYQLYREVDALAEDTEIYNADSVSIEKNGVMYDIPLDLNQFKEFLLQLAPEDAKPIKKLCKAIGLMANTNMVMGPPADFKGFIQFFKESRNIIPLGIQYQKVTVKEILQKFQNETIKELITSLMPAEFSAMALIMMLGTRMGGNAGYPMGGALDVVNRMESKYLGLGGKIRLNSKVDEIIVKDGKVAGVMCKGKPYSADGVVAACDAYDTLQRMLKGKYAHPQLDKMLKESPLFPPLAVVSFGLNKKLGIPFGVTYECPQGIAVAPDSKTYGYSLRSFDFDDAAAPEGTSSVMAMLEAPLDYWQKLRKDNLAEYGSQKKRLAATLAEEIDKRIPGFKDAISVVDVSTPATYVRLTNTYRASFEGFLPTPEALTTKIQKTVDGVSNLFLCGQWTIAGGGICSAINDGKTIADRMQKTLMKG